MLTLTEEQVKQLEAIISELPTKFGIPILNILNAKKDEENTDEEN